MLISVIYTTNMFTLIIEFQGEILQILPFSTYKVLCLILTFN